MTNVTEIPQEFKDFLQFCEEQPKNRPIDHTGAWGECAVGDYIRETGAKKTPYCFSYVIFGWNDDLRGFVGDACDYPEASTYGGFVEGMKKIVYGNEA